MSDEPKRPPRTAIGGSEKSKSGDTPPEVAPPETPASGQPVNVAKVKEKIGEPPGNLKARENAFRRRRDT